MRLRAQAWVEDHEVIICYLQVEMTSMNKKYMNTAQKQSRYWSTNISLLSHGRQVIKITQSTDIYRISG